MKILIISGFLGAGKTTFIKELVKKTKKKFAILENEYGTSGIDKSILNGDMPDGKLNIWEMTEGCICCSMKNDFAASVLTIANSMDPDYLIVEPTGVGRLSGVIQSLQQIEYERISLLAPVTIVDGQSYMRYLKEYPELYRDQIAAAYTIVVSKMERASTSELSWLKAELQKQNPSGEVVTEHYSGMDLDFWNRLLIRNFDGSCEKVCQEPQDLQELPEVVSLEDVFMPTPETLFYLIEQVIYGGFGNIVRAKGILKAGDQVFQFDVADGKYAVRGAESASGKGNGKAVFIGTEIDKERIWTYFCKSPKKISYKNKLEKNGNK